MKVNIDSITDNNVKRQHFGVLHRIINNDYWFKYNDYSKTCDTLEDLGYIDIKRSNWSTSCFSVKTDRYLVLEESVSDILTDYENIFHLERSYRVKNNLLIREESYNYKGNTEQRYISEYLIRLYSYVYLENKKGIFQILNSKIKKDILLGSGRHSGIDFLLYMLKEMRLFSKENGVYYENKKPEIKKAEVVCKREIIEENLLIPNLSFILNSVQQTYSFKTAFNVLNINQLKKNISGIYVFLNEQKDILYVGQAKDLKSRVKCHLAGLTNTSSYCEEFKYVAVFPVKKFREFGNTIEKDMIKTLEPKYNVVYNTDVLSMQKAI